MFGFALYSVVAMNSIVCKLNTTYVNKKCVMDISKSLFLNNQSG